MSVLPLLAGLVVAAAPTYLIRFSIAGIPTTVLELLIYAFVALVVVTRWGRFRPVPRPLLWPTFLFLLAAVISTIIAPDQRAALGILKAWIVDPLLFAWAVWQLADQRGAITLLLSGLVAGGMVVSLAALYQKLTGQATPDGRVIGPYAWSAVENASPNYLALYLAPLAVLAFGLTLGESRKRRIFFGLGGVLAVLAIYLSLSRGGLAAVGIGLLVLAIWRFWPMIRRRVGLRLGVAALIVGLAIGAWYYIQPNPGLAPEQGGRVTASNNVRWEIWQTTVNEVLSGQSTVLSLPKWITGIGLGNFQPYFTELTRGRVNYDRIAPLALTPHNLFLGVWVNLGLLGLLSFVWLLVEFFRRGFGTISAQSIPLLSSMSALLAHGLLDTPYFKNDLALLFWTLVALMVILSEKSPKTKR